MLARKQYLREGLTMGVLHHDTRELAMFEKAIITYTAVELKAHLRSFLLQAITLGEESQRLAARMAPFGCDLSPVRGIRAADSALRTWVRAVEAQASEEYAEGTGAVLRLADIEGLSFPNTVPDVGFSADRTESMRWDWIVAEKRDLKAQTEVMDKLLESIDFLTLEKGLQIEADGLAEKGKRDAADALANFLNLTGYARKPTALKPKGLMFTLHYGGTQEGLDRYDFRGVLTQTADAIRIAEDETGIAGLGSTLNGIASELSRTVSHKNIPSRTQMGVPGLLSVTIFKNHSEFVMESSRADALLSFVAMYSTRELRDVHDNQRALAL